MNNQENEAGKEKKKMTKGKKILITLLCIFGAMILYAMGSGSGDDNADRTSTDNTVQVEDTTTDATTDTTTDTTTEPSATMGEKNALDKAADYLAYTAFSYSGLISQLEFEGFSTAEATYAVDNCGADWNEQAAKKAQEYLDYSSFSRSGLIDQLEFEGFNAEQAAYGATAVGY